jgi:hypothetical protein
MALLHGMQPTAKKDPLRRAGCHRVQRGPIQPRFVPTWFHLVQPCAVHGNGGTRRAAWQAAYTATGHIGHFLADLVQAWQGQPRNGRDVGCSWSVPGKIGHFLAASPNGGLTPVPRRGGPVTR